MRASRAKVACRRDVKVPGEREIEIAVRGNEDMREEREEVSPALPERGMRHSGMHHQAGKYGDHDENPRLAGHEIVDCAGRPRCKFRLEVIHVVRP